MLVAKPFMNLSITGKFPFKFFPNCSSIIKQRSSHGNDQTLLLLALKAARIVFSILPTIDKGIIVAP